MTLRPEDIPPPPPEWRTVTRKRSHDLGPLPEAPRSIVEALGAPEDHDGHKWHLLGHVGGLMRQAGYSEESCAAVVEEWLEGTGADLAVARERALGAWRCDEGKVSGEEALAAFIGEEHAALVARTVDEEAWPRGARLEHAKRVAALKARPVERATAAYAGAEEDWDWSTPDVPIPYLCEGLALAPSERKVTLLAGDPGAGKGPLANHVAACFAFGVPVLGAFPVTACNVGVLDFEGARLSARRIRSHARGLGKAPEALSGHVFLRDVAPGVPVEWIAEWCEERAIKVLIVDSYTSAMMASGIDPNAPEYAGFAAELGTLDLCTIVIAHARKAPRIQRGERPSLGDIAGSFALAGMAQTAIALWRPDDEDKTLASVACLRAPEVGFDTFDVRWESGGTDAEPSWTGRIAPRADAKKGEDAANDERLNGVCARLIAAFGTEPLRPLGVPRLAELGALKRDAVVDGLYALEQGGIIRREFHGNQALARLVTDGRGLPSVRVVGGKAVPTNERAGTGRFAR